MESALFIARLRAAAGIIFARRHLGFDPVTKGQLSNQDALRMFAAGDMALLHRYGELHFSAAGDFIYKIPGMSAAEADTTLLRNLMFVEEILEKEIGLFLRESIDMAEGHMEEFDAAIAQDRLQNLQPPTSTRH